MKRFVLSLAVWIFAMPLQGLAAQSAAPVAPAEKAAQPAVTPPRSANAHTVGEYPELSRVNREEGTVTVRFTINTDGSVSNARLAHSSGYPRLDQAALDQVSTNWRYYPATRNGEPMAVETEANVRFTLVGEEDSRFRTVRMQPKDFPPGTREKGMRGTTVLLIVVGEDDKVAAVEVMQSSGYDELDKAAETFVRGWSFKTALLNGKPITSGIGCTIEWPPG